MTLSKTLASAFLAAAFTVGVTHAAVARTITVDVTGTLSAQGADAAGLDGADYAAQYVFNVFGAPDSTSTAPSSNPFVFTSTWNASSIDVDITDGAAVLLDYSRTTNDSSTGRMQAWNTDDAQNSQDDFVRFFTTFISNPFGGGSSERIDVAVPTWVYSDNTFFAGTTTPALSDIAFDSGAFTLGVLSYRETTFGQIDTFDLTNANVVLTDSEAAPVPLPASVWLMVAGLGALTVARRKRA